MGTTIEAWCRLEADIQPVERWFETVEATCSRFRVESELTLVNESPGERVRLSPTLLEILQQAEHARAITEGLVDVGMGSAVKSWGYDTTFDSVVDLADQPSGIPPAQWRLEGSELVRTPGTSIDLGGIAKGWTCDRAVEMKLARVVSAGGDIRSAHPETVVPVIDPWGETAARVRLGERALATSSTARRRWRVAGKEASHLIDPRTGSPVLSPVLSATVIAETATLAEIGAKAVLIKGEHGLAWADDTDWVLAAMVIWHDGSVYGTKTLELVA